MGNMCWGACIQEEEEDEAETEEPKERKCGPAPLELSQLPTCCNACWDVLSTRICVRMNFGQQAL